MNRPRLADTVMEIGRIQGGPPPLVGRPWLGDTLVSRPWRNIPFEAYVPGMRHHVVAAVHRGHGLSRLSFDGRHYCRPSATGSTVIMPKGRDGRWDCTGSPTCSNVYLGEARLQLCADEVGHGRRPELRQRLNVDDPKLFRILGLIADESHAEDAISRLYMEQLLDLLCLQLLRAHSVFPVAQAKRRSGLGAWQVRRVTDYMQAHLDEDVGLQELADLLDLSRFHFCTAFRQATGSTPHRWLVRLRMRRATELLADPAARVTDVALAVGYQTPSSFALAFRSAFGVTPSDYRGVLWERWARRRLPDEAAP